MWKTPSGSWDIFIAVATDGQAAQRGCVPYSSSHPCFSFLCFIRLLDVCHRSHGDRSDLFKTKVCD